MSGGQKAMCAVLCALPLVAGPVAAAASERLAGPFVAHVQRVVDGDTLVVEVPVWLGMALTTSVRIRGIDAPELHGKCQGEKDLAEQARLLLQREATAQVTLRDVEGDKFYGRVEADVTTVPDGLNLAQAMLAGGLARTYDGGKRGGWCGLASAGN